MLLTLISPLLMVQAHAAPGPTQVWEKRIMPGLVYHMEWDPTTPRVIHALRISLHTDTLHPYAQLAGRTVFEATPEKGRETISQMVKEDGALAGINGDFFPFTGDPTGLMVREGELLSSPYFSKQDPDAYRAAFGWGPGQSTMQVPRMNLSVKIEGGETLSAEGFDENAGPDRITVDSPAVGLALASAKTPNTYAVLHIASGAWAPNSELDGTVESVGNDLKSLAVEQGQAVIVASGRQMPRFSGLQTGQHVHIGIRTTGFDFDKIRTVIGGGPELIRNGQINVDWTQERFIKSFVEARHPRTAIGRTNNGDLWWVVVDGRSSISAGATLLELAGIMQKFGCVDAMNLDGGGSTTFDLFGATINRPSDGTERYVANGVLLMAGKRPEPTQEALRLSELAKGARAGATNHLDVLRGRHVIPNAEVVWVCTGAGWIDQGGNLHVLGAGTARVTAFVRGVTLTADYTVKGTTAKPEGAHPGGRED